MHLFFFFFKKLSTDEIEKSFNQSWEDEEYAEAIEFVTKNQFWWEADLELCLFMCSFLSQKIVELHEEDASEIEEISSNLDEVFGMLESSYGPGTTGDSARHWWWHSWYVTCLWNAISDPGLTPAFRDFY